MKRFNEITIENLKAELDSGEIKPRELLEKAKKRVDAVEPELNALNRDTFDRAGEQVKHPPDYDQPYRGIPCIIKDNICTFGVQTNCSSKILDGFIPPYTATVDARVTEAGFLMVGKANMDEFGMGSSTEYSAWGPSCNPFDLSRVPGGSSGGSAAAVAAGYAAFALGSDTGGSVRQPAAFCGNVGLRPTYGRVSRYGLIMFASSLDQIGPITATVRGSARVLGIIEGPDKHDSTLVTTPAEDYLAHIEDGIEDLRVGVLNVSYADWVDERVKTVFSKNVNWFKDHAKSVKEVKINSFDTLLAAYYIIAPAEASSNLARYDGISYGPSVEIAGFGKDIDENNAAELLDF
ncbi:MAG: amidase family protein, partial [bacterium]|nr:amidase family protein [bacterium]